MPASVWTEIDRACDEADGFSPPPQIVQGSPLAEAAIDLFQRDQAGLNPAHRRGAFARSVHRDGKGKRVTRPSTC